MFNLSRRNESPTSVAAQPAMAELSMQEQLAVSGGEGSVPQPSCTAVRVRDGYVIVCK